MQGVKSDVLTAKEIRELNEELREKQAKADYEAEKRERVITADSFQI